MGILFHAVNIKNQLKQQMVFERLSELGITHSQQGKLIQELSYEEMKYELILAEMKQVDIDHPDHVWFR